MAKSRKSQRVTIMDVARESGVSYSTVSRVLNGFEFVKESTRTRVLATADKLGYVANIQARTLAGGKSNVIGLLVPAINGFVGEITQGVDEELAEIDFDMMLFTTHRQRGRETSYVNHITNGLSAGLLLIVPLVSEDYIDQLNAQQFPYVLIDQTDPTGRSAMVNSTNRQGAYEITKYLIELGHRRIAHITGIMAANSAVERFEGFKAAMNEYGIPIRDDYIVSGDFWRAKAQQATEKLLALDELPTAIFAGNDLTAFTAMRVLHEHGLSVPQDMSIVGFDDIPQAVAIYPRLTTVRQPLNLMGRTAVKHLLELIEDPQRPRETITLETELIIRESCLPFQGGD